MDKEALERHLQALAAGNETSNHKLVEAYLEDAYANAVGQLMMRVTSRHRKGRLLLPPSHCLPPLD